VAQRLQALSLGLENSGSGRDSANSAGLSRAAKVQAGAHLLPRVACEHLGDNLVAVDVQQNHALGLVRLQNRSVADLAHEGLDLDGSDVRVLAERKLGHGDGNLANLADLALSTDDVRNSEKADEGEEDNRRADSAASDRMKMDKRSVDHFTLEDDKRPDTDENNRHDRHADENDRHDRHLAAERVKVEKRSVDHFTLKNDNIHKAFERRIHGDRAEL